MSTSLIWQLAHTLLLFDDVIPPSLSGVFLQLGPEYTGHFHGYLGDYQPLQPWSPLGNLDSRTRASADTAAPGCIDLHNASVPLFPEDAVVFSLHANTEVLLPVEECLEVLGGRAGFRVLTREAVVGDITSIIPVLKNGVMAFGNPPNACLVGGVRAVCPIRLADRLDQVMQGCTV